MTEVLKIGEHGYQINDAEAEWLTERLGAAGGLVPPATEQKVPEPAMPHNLAAALAAVQAEIPEVVKAEEGRVEKDGKFLYKYSYADLSAVTRAILPMLGRVGLSWVTMPTVVDGKFVLVYRLQHASGDVLEGTYPLPAGQSPQQTGSAITYARRYCLCSVTGIAPSDDDDAAEAQAGYRNGDRPEETAARPAGMSAFERDAGMAFLARPSADRRKTTPTSTLHAALQQALDFGRCLDEHKAWDERVGDLTWGEALAARVADEIEHADIQADLNTLWRMLKAASYNPEVEGKNMTSRIKERAAAIVARNAQTLDDLGKQIIQSTEAGDLEGRINTARLEAEGAGWITGPESDELLRMLHDRLAKLQRGDSAYDEDGSKPTSPELRGGAPIDGDDPWAGTGE